MNRIALFVVSMAVLAFGPRVSAADAPSADGLVSARAKDFDQLLVRPNTELSAYRKIMVDRVQVAFADGWMESMNDTRDVTPRIGDEGARRIAEETASSLQRILAETFEAAGYQIVTVPGSDVLHLSPKVSELYVNNPERLPPGRSRVYTKNAGEATLTLEAREASSGQLVARFVDHRIARESQGLTRSTGPSSRYWLEAMFRKWASGAVKAFKVTGGPGPVASQSTGVR